ncbi:MAG: lysophospholipid acyltransferase family protein [Acidimicrobiales bacterium]
MSRSVYGRQDADTVTRSRQSLPGRIAYRIFWVMVYIPVKLLFRLRVEGRERFPDGPFILAPVHRSFIDTPIAGMLTMRRLRFMGKESLWNSKPLGVFLSVMGGFPVQRGSADRTALRAAEDVLALGEPLVMFPEGTRREGPRLKRDDMHDGPAFVAARAGVPIVPVGLGGSVKALPLGTKVPRPHKVVAVIGDPIPPPPKVEGRVPRRAVRELSEQLFRELGDLYVEARVLAGDEDA